MATSVETPLSPRQTDESDELASMLESLPSYSLLTSNADPLTVFEDEDDAPMGLIDLIRRRTLSSEEDNADAPNTVSRTKRWPEEMPSFNSLDGETTGYATESISTSATATANERAIETSDADIDSCLLKCRVKHLFILSENGKPVFTRYGDEEKMVTLMGVMQTLVSFAELADYSQLNYLKAGRCRVAFLRRDPLLFVLVTHTNEHFLCLAQQLTYVYHQIISTLTLSRIKQKFLVQPNFDLRRWLSNAEKKLLHNLIDMYEHDLGLLMTSARCLNLSPHIRNQIGQHVVQIIRGQKDMVFAIILTHGHLVSIARLRNYHLHPSDLYLLVNLVNSSDAFKGVESWVPVCLPRFDSGGCLHAHISYLDDPCDVCLVLLTVNPEEFQVLSNFKQLIGEKLRKSNLIQPIKQALEKSRSPSSDIACVELRYFAYKSRGLSQYTSSKLSKPYLDSEQHTRLFESIRYVYGHLHNPNHRLKHIYHTTEHESILGWLTSGFELYAVFAPFVSVEVALQCTDRILSYIKRDENQLFILKCEYI